MTQLRPARAQESRAQTEAAGRFARHENNKKPALQDFLQRGISPASPSADPAPGLSRASQTGRLAKAGAKPTLRAFLKQTEAKDAAATSLRSDLPTSRYQSGGGYSGRSGSFGGTAPETAKQSTANELDAGTYQKKLQELLSSGRTVEDWHEQAKADLEEQQAALDAAKAKTKDSRRGVTVNALTGNSGNVAGYTRQWEEDRQAEAAANEAFLAAQREYRYADVAFNQKCEEDARKRAEDAGLSPEAWYEQAAAAATAADDKTAKAEAGSFRQRLSELGFLINGDYDNYRAVKEAGEGVGTELDAAREDRTAATEDLTYAKRAYWESLPEREDFAAGVERGRADEDNKVERALRDEQRLSESELYDPYKYEEETDWDLQRLLDLTDEERQIYAYLLGTKGKDEADAYLRDMNESLNYRAGKRIADEIENKEGAGRVVAELGQAAGTGLDNAGRGLLQNFYRDALPTSASAYAGQLTRQAIEQRGGPELLGHSVEGIAYDAVNTVANMAPSLAIGALTGGAGGAVAIGLQSKGNAYQQALQQGYTRGQANAYSTVIGAAEGGLQYLLGGFEKLGGVQQFTNKMTARIGNGTLRAMAELGIDVLGENTEEYLQNKLEPWMRNTIFGEHNEIRLWDEEDAYTVLLTTLTTGVMNAPGTVQAVQLGKLGRQYMQTGKTDTLLALAGEFSAAPEVQAQAEAMLRGETPVTERSVGELAVAYDRAGGDLSALIRTEDADGKKTAPDGAAAWIPYSEKEANNLLSSQKNKVLGYGTTIKEFVQNAIMSKGQGGRLYLGKIPKKTSELIRQKTGLHVDGFSYIVNGTEIWHAFKSHSDPDKEAKKGQVALTQQDFERLPIVVSDPDSVELSEKPDGNGRPAIVFRKQFDHEYVTVQGYSNGKKGLAFDSMWKRKGKPPVTSHADSDVSPGQTPETSAGTASQSEENSSYLNISQTGIEVNAVQENQRGQRPGETLGRDREMKPEPMRQTELRRQAKRQTILDPARRDLPPELRRALAAEEARMGEDRDIIRAAYHRGQDVHAYVLAMRAGINLLAAQGTNREALDRVNMTRVLTEDQRDAAWQVGHRKYEAWARESRLQKVNRSDIINETEQRRIKSGADERAATAKEYLTRDPSIWAVGLTDKGPTGLYRNDIHYSKSYQFRVGSFTYNGKTVKNTTNKVFRYVKNTPDQVMILRKKFNSSIRKSFLKSLAAEQYEALLDAGFSKKNVAKMAEGRVPKGFHVHHIMPLDDSGDNTFGNLILIDTKNHAVLTSYQNSFCKKLNPGESMVVIWPFLKGDYYISKGE